MNPNNSKRVRYAPVNVSAILTDKESVVSLFALCVPVLMVPNMTGIFDAGKKELQEKITSALNKNGHAISAILFIPKIKSQTKKKYKLQTKKAMSYKNFVSIKKWPNENSCTNGSDMHLPNDSKREGP